MKHFIHKIFSFFTISVLSLSAFAGDFYWVGNSGSWNDPSHWSNSSGGQGGFGTPSLNDDVYFDVNSFQAPSFVEINAQAFCKSFIWTATEENGLSGSSELTVKKDFLVNNSLKNNFFGAVNLVANHGTVSLNPGNIVWHSDFNFNGSATFNLQNNFGTDKAKSITFNSGGFVTNGNVIYTGNLIFGTGYNANVNLSNSDVYIFESYNITSVSPNKINVANTTIIYDQDVQQASRNDGGLAYAGITEKATCATPIPIDFTVTVTSNYNGAQISCNGNCDGQITISINSGGGGPYGIQLDDGGGPVVVVPDSVVGSNYYLNGLCADTYNATIIDSSQNIFGNVYESCTDFGTVIAAPPAIGVTVQGFLNPTCPSTCDGSIFTSIGGGTGALSIDWPTIPFSGEDPTNVCTGSYPVNVMDINGCTFSTTVDLADPPAIQPFVTINGVTCSGVCDAQAFVTPSGGNGAPFTYDWVATSGGGSLSATDTVNGLCELTQYTVSVFDVDGCQQDTTFTVPDKPDMVLSATGIVDATCFGVCDGQMNVSASGASGTFIAYDWYQGLFGAGTYMNSSQSQNALCAFTDYYVVVTDDEGCQDSIQMPQLNSPPQITFTSTVNDLLCFGDGNGSIDITVSGGTPITPAPAYTYSWSTSNGSGLNVSAEDQTTLSGGDYQVVATDANGCQDSTQFTVIEPTEIFANGTTTDNSCFNVIDGVVNLSTTGGVGGYSWTWASTVVGFVDPGTEDLNPADSGCYSVHITDANSCTLDTTLCLITPGEIFANATITPITCNGDNDAAIDIEPNNGVGNYVYDWSNNGLGAYTDPQDLSGLSPNSYQVFIQDDNGCVKDTSIIITDPPLLTLSETHVDLTCFGAADGAIDLTVSGGTGVVNVSWTGPSFTSSNEDISGLDAGQYDVTATDANGCTATLSVTLNQPGDMIANGTTTDLTCFNTLDGAIDLTPSGGDGVYTYTWTSTNVGFVDPGTEDLSNLDSATYCVHIEDGNTCSIDTCLVVNKPGEIYANATVSTILCNGDDNATIDQTPVNGVGAYVFDWDINGLGSFTDAEDQGPLGPGTYQVFIQDGNGCTKDTTYVITEPTLLTITTDSTESTCNNADGTVTVTATGGTVATDYTYNWINSATANSVGTTATITGLAAGCYDITVTDDNGCTASHQVCFSDASAPSATFVLTDNTCYQSCDGGIDITVSGGVAPLNTVWTSTDAGFVDPNTDDIFNLCAADYTLTITDANNCVFTQTESINEPNPIQISAIITDVLCFGDATGAVDATTTGGTVAGNYSFAWTGTGGFSAATEDISVLVAGTYDLHVVDDNNCTLDTTITITENTEVVLTTSSIDAQCGVSNGSVSVSASGGIVALDYSYSWVDIGGSPVTGGNAASVFNVTGGTYTVTVTDDNGCVATATEAVSEGNSPAITVDNFTDVTCNGANDGTANVTGTGGVGILTYSWSTVPSGGPAPGATQNATNMAPDTYVVTVTDAVGCSATEVVTIAEPTSLSVPGIVSDALCNGGNGSVDITPTGGTGPFTFDWSNDGTLDFDDSEDLSAIAGTYDVTVVDANNCNTTGTFTINEPTAITASTSTTTSTCTQSDGSLTVVPSNGTPGTPPNDYTYEWYPAGQTSPILGNAASLSAQPAGCYDVLITDANGCTISTSDCISDANGPTLSSVDTPVTCNGGTDGVIDLSVSGGTPGYNFSWTGPNGFTDSNEDVFSLETGEYSVAVTDATGCISGLTDTITEANGITSTAILTNPSCAGDFTGAIDITLINAVGSPTFSWTGPNSFSDSNEDITGLEQGQYCVSVSDANGCTLDTCFNLSDPTAIAITTNNVSTACTSSTGEVSVSASGGTVALDYIYDWDYDGTGDNNDNATETGLGVGTYNVTVFDDNGCTATGSETITTSSGPTVTLASSTDVDCNGNVTGAIFVDITGGTTPFTISWSTVDGSGIVSGNEDQTALGAGTYDLDVTDAAGCSAPTLTTTLSEPSTPLSISGITTNLACTNDNSGSIDISVTGGTSPYSYNWTESSNFVSAVEDPNGLSALTYDVTVTDNNGCTISDSYTLVENSVLVLNGSSVGSSCGNSDGSVSVSASGGVVALDYSYSWSDVTTSQPGTSFGGNNSSETGLPAGSYQVVVMDDSSCVDSTIVTVSDVNGPALTYSITDVNCYGDANGQIDLSATGTPTITYVWAGPAPFAGSTNEDISGLEAGTYTISATDGLGCITNDAVDVGGPIAPIDATAVVTDLICFDDASGEIDLTITGGTTPYNFTNWNGPNGFTSTAEDLIGLDSGLYTVDIEDANGCSASFSFNVSQPDSLILTPTIVQPTCGLTDGSVSVVVSGGTIASDYNYQWTNVTTSTTLGSTNSETNLGAGNYQIDVVDDNGCTVTDVLAVSEDAAPPLTTVVTGVDCNGNTTGAIDLTVAGTNSYTYQWDDPASSTTEDLSGLTAGTYNVLVNDIITGCTAAASVDVTEPTVLSMTGSSADLFCNGDGSGTIDITVNGGTMPYTFGWSTADGSGLIPNNEDQTGLGAGTYQITVIDDNGCQQINTFTLVEPNSISVTASVTNNVCFGEALGAIDVSVSNGVMPYTYSWTGSTTSSNEDLSSLAAGTYNLTITDDNLCTKDTLFTVTEPSQVIFNVTTVDASCTFSDGSATANVSGGTVALDYTYDWSPDGFTGDGTNAYTNIPAGVYNLNVVDDNSCSVDTTITINNINGPTITVDNISDVSCFGSSDGSIDVTVTAGTAPYTYIWNPNAISQQEDLSNVPADDYTLQVTDAAGCISFETATVAEPTEVTATLASNDATCGLCNGDATISPTGGTGAYSILWSDGQSSTSASNLCAGLYTVQVTDANNCAFNIDVPISNTGGPTGETTSITDVTCGGGSDGQVGITPTGGTAPYNIYWPHNGSVANPLTNMSAGSYFVEITDDNGCIRVISVDVAEPSIIDPVATITPASCGGSDGEILISASGGTGSLNYTWSSSANTTNNETGLSQGNVTLTVTDGSGCSVSDVYFVPGINAPSLSLTPTDVLCNGNANGQITGAVTGAVGSMTYQWYDNSGIAMAGETAIDILNQPAGDYTLEGTDAGTGCIAYATVTIDEPDAISLALTSTIDASCTASCDGQATVQPNGGTLGYTYQWTGGQTSQTATGLCSGINTVLVTDANSCTIQQTFVIGEDLTLDGSASVVDATCGLCDGQATVTPTGGSGSYTVNWFDGSTGTSASNLCAGVYSYTIDDANGCSQQFDITVNNVGGPDNETISQNDVTCYGGSDGDVTVTPSGGTSPYTYFWVPTGQTSNSISNLEAGNYNLEVTDANGCTRVVPITIAEPVELTVQSLVVDANCGNSDGSITLQVSGGASPYTYSWTGPSAFVGSNASETGLAVGVYNITITDANGCTQTVTLPVNSTNGPDLSVNGTNISCFGLADGSATVVASNGSGNYSYNWTVTGSSTDTDANLNAGIQTVEVTDINTGCVSIAQVNINEPDSISLSVPGVIDASCFGACDGEANVIPSGGELNYTFSWSSGGSSTNELNLCQGLVTATVTDANGCSTTQDMTINEPAQIVISVDNVTDALCLNSNDGSIDISVTGGTGSYTYDWDNDGTGDFDDAEDQSSLFPMNYIINVMDANGCTEADTILVDTTIVVLANAGLDTAFCNGGCVVVTGTGVNATTFEWYDLAGNMLTNVDTAQVCPDSVGVTPYVFFVSNAQCSHTDTVNVTVNGLPSVDAGEDIEEIYSSDVTLGGSPTGPTGSTYQWTPLTNFINQGDSTAANPIVDLIAEDDYIVFVTDTNGCLNSDTIHIQPIPEIKFPNGFTPNGDGVNDIWQIDYITEFPESVVEVYNRWGEQLFISVGYTTPWDGKYNGKPLPIGTYYYVINLNHPKFPDAYVGPITIMR